jgi:HK97 gp10 family phage protein
MFKVDTDFGGVFDALDGIVEASAEAVRPAAQAGAETFYLEVLLRVPVSLKDHTFYGTHAKYKFSAGALRRSVYQTYSKDHSGYDKATYHVAWNHQKAPYGFMVEFGTSRAPAHPFLRPAFDAAQQQALQNASYVFNDRVKQAIHEGI